MLDNEEKRAGDFVDSILPSQEPDGPVSTNLDPNKPVLGKEYDPSKSTTPNPDQDWPPKEPLKEVHILENEGDLLEIGGMKLSVPVIIGILLIAFFVFKGK
jgi:hypothetical protein